MLQDYREERGAGLTVEGVGTGAPLPAVSEPRPSFSSVSASIQGCGAIIERASLRSCADSGTDGEDQVKDGRCMPLLPLQRGAGERALG